MTGVILAKAGWRVLVVERSRGPGGAVRTEEVTLPGFRHDLFAANLNLFAGSPFFQEYGDELAAQGLEFAPSSKPFASVFPDGRFLGVTTDAEETLGMIRSLSEPDARSWEDLSDRFGRIAPHLFPLLGVELPSVAAVLQLLRGTRALGRSWPFDLGRLVLQSTREFTEEHFESREVQALVAAWGMHLDFAPDISGGALFPYLETFADAANGMVLGKGGASAIIDALVALLHESGGELRLGTPVTEIAVVDRTATGVTLDSGERFEAGRAVVANLTPTVLSRLLPEGALTPRARRLVNGYRYGPGTMMIHLALDDLPTWTAGDVLREFAYVHIGPYLDDMSRAYQEAVAGSLPERPMLVVGQPTAVDPSRAPDGKHILWVQVRVVPGSIQNDAARRIQSTDWDDAKELYADRVLDLIDEHAPGIRGRILARHVLSPADLERTNPNLVGGDSLSGSHHLMQHFALRPLPGWTHYRTPVKRLHMCGAATWPGAGVGAGSGYLLGKRLTRPTPRITRG